VTTNQLIGVYLVIPSTFKKIYNIRHKITNYSQQDADFLEFISTNALHVWGGSSTHHQEYIQLQALSTYSAASCYRG